MSKRSKHIVSLILAALALVCLIWCGVNAFSIIKEYRYLPSTNPSGADYLGVYIGFRMQLATAFLGCLFSAIAFFLADRRWVRFITAVLFVLLIASVIVVICFR